MQSTSGVGGGEFAGHGGRSGPRMDWSVLRAWLRLARVPVPGRRWLPPGGLAVWAVVSVAAALAACGSVPKAPGQVVQGDYASVTPYFAERIRYQMKENELVGLSVALIDDQRVVWSEGFGFSDRANETPATPDTVYRAGSVSKLLTSMLAMQLVEQGRMRLDRPVQRYVPEFSVKSRFVDAGPITLRQLMTHHSGLMANLSNGMWTGHPQPFETLLKDLKDEYVLYPPNYMFSYSNVGTTVLGIAVQRAAGRDFARLATQSLLKPLGMESSRFSMTLTGENVSRAYQGGQEVSELPLRDVPASGLNTSVKDLSRFVRMVLAEGRAANGRQILQPRTMVEMLRPQNAYVDMDQGSSPVGLGWHLGRRFESREPMIEHSGATVAHRALVRILPWQKLGVVLMANTGHAEEIIDELADEMLGLAMEVKTGVRPKDIEVPARMANQRLPEALRDAYVGQYTGAFGYGTIEMARKGLRAHFVDKRFELFRREDDTFGLKYELMGMMDVTPHALSRVGLERRTLGGHEVLFVHTPAGGSIVAEKIEPEPIGPAWRRRAGNYVVDGVSREGSAVMSEVALIEKDGFLMLQYGFPPFEDEVIAMPLKILSDTEAIVRGVGNGLGYTLQVVKAPDGSERLRVLGYELKRVVGR
ncbi:MAG: serine hydrolase domain-containing protein [Lautropia sp.]|nr:serine hydrolase domain-containing protein [Lautropia sp.]